MRTSISFGQVVLSELPVRRNLTRIVGYSYVYTKIITSVYMAFKRKSSAHPVSCRAPHPAVEAQFVEVFQRVLRFDEGAGRVVQPVVEPGQQEAQGAAAGEEGEGGQFR